MKVKEESEKAGLKLIIQNTHTVASGSITSWHIDGDKMEIVINFIFLGWEDPLELEMATHSRTFT